MRLALSMLTACGFAFLTACGSGFSGSTTSTTPGVVVLEPGAGQADDFFVAPSGTAPLAISAIAYSGSGQLATIVPDVSYTWAARFVNPATDPVSVATYSTGSAPNGFHACPAMPAVTPPVPILMQSNPSTNTTAYPGYALLPATSTANEVFLGAVPGVTPPYCLVILATSVPGNVIGSATAIVSYTP
jgi:hypothetical protein